MTAKESLMVKFYKNRIKKLQLKQSNKLNAGACIAIQGEIQAYNAVISDLINDRNFLNEDSDPEGN